MIVLDASAAFAMVTAAAEGEAFWAFAMEGEKMIAPTLFRFELLNVVRKYVKAGFATEKAALEWYRSGIALVDEFHSMDGAEADILHESLRLDHSSYDLAYLVLARRTGATLFTLDGKLADACERCGVSCTGVVAL